MTFSPLTVSGTRFPRIFLILPIAAATFVSAICFPAVRLLSQGREYAADRRAGILTGAPSVLASALLKLEHALEGIPTGISGWRHW